jgi:HEPN domain-containing protein
MRARKHPNYDAVCFHTQQCIEKLMKAVLIRKKRVPPHTHDLIRLCELLRKAVRGTNFDEAELDLLSTGAVVLRYPGKFATRTDAQRAMRICRQTRTELQRFL